ncbi:MAG: FtsB family cell division protein [Candidatus Electronema sp. V4]|uniref:FtsB family cell division protein n=1 Tax=Candidatus Electronema sp. V4 TaxID=3454756 RepID=UPI0040553ADE
MARILSAAFLLSLFFLAFTPGRSLRSLRQVRQQAEAVAEENKTLLRQTMQLAEEIRLLQHDERHLEQLAREKYGMLKKNEEVYYYEPVEPAEPVAPPESDSAAVP